MVKRAVEEYIAQREGNYEPEKVNSKESKKPKKKSERQENRLSGLLNSAPKKKSIKCVQIKWYRYNENVAAYQLVRVNQGGGCRFMEVNEDITFSDVTYKATDMFFDDSFKNPYGENTMDCTFYICDASLNEFDEEANLFEYVIKNGFQLSKTYFVLKSQLTSFDIVNNDNDSSCGANSTKRKICMACGYSYINNCLICIQNAEYSESLMNDQRKREQSYSRNEPSTSESITSTITTFDDEHYVSPEEIRVLRVEQYEKKKQIFRIHRMKVATDLINHFIENNVCISLCVYIYIVNIVKHIDINRPKGINSRSFTMVENKG